MVDTVINYLDKFGPELLVIQFGLLVILCTLFLWLWFSNRRKYHNLKHAIPANVVKNYLDSIIQNSTALKSSLFRGGGTDVGNVPSVMPLQNLMGGDGLAVSGAPSTALLEEVNQKKALIASLESQLSSLQNSGKEIEKKLANSQGTLTTAEKKIQDLEDLLNQAKSGEEGATDGALKSELDMVLKERNEIRDRLKEFEIIADDLANLKRLQQENEQLKKSLAAAGLTPAAAAQEPVKEEPDALPASQADVSDLLEDLGQSNGSNSTDNKALEEFLGSDDSSSESISGGSEALEELEASSEDDTSMDAPVVEENADEVKAGAEEDGSEDKSKPDKTPEDLLSEFEKMLG